MAESIALEVDALPASGPNGGGETVSPSPLPVAVPMVTRFSPNELRVLKAATGRTLTDLQTDENDMMQAMAWIGLYRLGHRVTWEQAGDCYLDMRPEAPDPLAGGTTTSSQRSADSGG